MDRVGLAGFIIMTATGWLGIKYTPKVYPEKAMDLFIFLSFLASASTYLGVTLFPAALPSGPLVSLVCFGILALLPPFVGLAEARFRTNGQLVYASGRQAGGDSRFPLHLLSNMAGAGAIAALVVVAYLTDGFSGFVQKFADDAAFNILLPFTTLFILAYVRWQQIDKCANVDELANAKMTDPEWERCIVGFSLRHWHQFLNTLYLIVATFWAVMTLLYLFAFAMEQAKSGHPLKMSWPFAVIIAASLSFLFVCGLPKARKHEAVFLTFQTGTPAALCAVLVWFSLFQSDPFRNIAAISIVIVGYLGYCLLLIVPGRKQGKPVQLHYFSAAGIVLVLVGLLVGVAFQ